MGVMGMKHNAAPTTVQNVQSRLFLRFFLLYWLAFPVGVLLYIRGARFVPPDAARWLVTCPAALALLGAVLTVSKPYLFLLSICHGLVDAVLIAGVTAGVFYGQTAWLPYNGFLLLVLLSCLLYCYAASQACWFAFAAKERDLRLLFSRAFAKFALTALILVTLLLAVCFLWPHFT